MTFLNAILLGGLAAASLPVLIHLFNKNRHRVVRWGAMHLLNAAFEKNQRRLNLEHILLLLVRCAIPAVLALCMARPVLTGAAKLLGDDKSSVVVLLDNSYSMESSAGATANFTSARDTAAKILTGAGRGSDFSVVLMAGGVAPLFDSPAFDAPRLVKELGKLDAGYGKANIPESLEAAASILARMQQQDREVVVITDFQKVSWSDAEASARARAVEQLKKLPLPPHITLLHIGAPGRDKIALQPFGQAKADLTDLIKPRVIQPQELTPAALTASRVVVLANVRQLSDAQLVALHDFVQTGGGLLVFPGSRISTDWYNRSLAGTNGLVPLPFLSLAGSLEDGAPRAKVVGEHFVHPALELFNDPRNGSLADAEIKLWFKLRRPDSANSNLTVLASLNTGDPFLVEKKFGEGRVIQCAVPCDADWGNLPTRPVYLPFMQRLVTYLASSVFPPRNVEVGKPLAAFLPRTDSGRVAVFTDPSGARHEVTVLAKGSRAMAEFSSAWHPGLYVMTAPDGGIVHFVASTSREESDLKALTPAEREGVAKAMGATLVNSLKEFQEQDHNRRYGREVWKPLLWAVLALLIGELVLQQWFAARK
ncbi:MAG: VWA domain-containing protein [Verrucomicrobia bacterium]|nr:VWA domain-containing protein [Verrucomicrobiota bacterium]